MPTPEQCTDCGHDLNEWYVIIYGGEKIIANLCEGCDRRRKVADFLKTGTMCSALVRDAISAKAYFDSGCPETWRKDFAEFCHKEQNVLLQIAENNEKLGKKARELENKIWLPTLKPYYDKSDKRGHRGKAKDYDALLWGSAGRVALTLQGTAKGKFGGAFVSLIFDETSETARGGIQGYCATFDVAEALLETAMLAFPKMKPNRNVSMF